jgi:hypothetical protein
VEHNRADSYQDQYERYSHSSPILAARGVGFEAEGNNSCTPLHRFWLGNSTRGFNQTKFFKQYRLDIGRSTSEQLGISRSLFLKNYTRQSGWSISLGYPACVTNR